MRRLASIIGSLVLACLAGSCEEPPPGTQIYVLVDLSETWFNEPSRARNERVLRELGQGIASYAEEAAVPRSIEHRPIGEASLLRDPLCVAWYEPSLVGRRSDEPGFYSRPDDLRDYLAVHCVDAILERKPEQRTEISATLASVADEPRGPNGRIIIIASDFLEETGSRAPLRRDALKGDRVLLIYRPLVEDQADPAELSRRVEEWRRSIERFGATVSAVPDPNIRRGQIASFLSSSK